MYDTLLGLAFTLDNCRKYFKDAEFSQGEGKRGTTPARVLRGDKFWIIESPRYENEIKCWLSQENTNIGKEINCKTVGDLVDALN